MVVVDAAVIVDSLLDLSADAALVRERLRQESVPWAAPELLDAEWPTLFDGMSCVASFRRRADSLHSLT